MPFYSGVCSNNHRVSFYSKIDGRDDARQCEKCGANLHRVLDAPSVRPEIPAYQSPIDGRWINSRAQRQEDLKRSGSIEWEPGIRQDQPRRRAEAEEKAFAPLEATIEKTARELVAAGKLDPL